MHADPHRFINHVGDKMLEAEIRKTQNRTGEEWPAAWQCLMDLRMVTTDVREQRTFQVTKRRNSTDL